jgi:hypothetical protein
MVHLVGFTIEIVIREVTRCSNKFSRECSHSQQWNSALLKECLNLFS